MEKDHVQRVIVFFINLYTKDKYHLYGFLKRLPDEDWVDIICYVYPVVSIPPIEDSPNDYYNDGVTTTINAVLKERNQIDIDHVQLVIVFFINLYTKDKYHLYGFLKRLPDEDWENIICYVYPVVSIPPSEDSPNDYYNDGVKTTINAVLKERNPINMREQTKELLSVFSESSCPALR